MRDSFISIDPIYILSRLCLFFLECTLLHKRRGCSVVQLFPNNYSRRYEQAWNRSRPSFGHWAVQAMVQSGARSIAKVHQRIKMGLINTFSRISSMAAWQLVVCLMGSELQCTPWHISTARNPLEQQYLDSRIHGIVSTARRKHPCKVHSCH